MDIPPELCLELLIAADFLDGTLFCPLIAPQLADIAHSMKQGFGPSITSLEFCVRRYKFSLLYAQSSLFSISSAPTQPAPSPNEYSGNHF